MSLPGDHDEKDSSLIDLSRDENDSDVDGRSRSKQLRLYEKLSTPLRIRYGFYHILLQFMNNELFFFVVP